MKIIYEDSQIIVCYKEAGLPVQSARIGVKDLESMLKNYLREQTGKPPYLGVIHRLDQPVEGVLVFAKNPQAAAGLSAQVSDGRMKKIYHAVVRLPEEAAGGEFASGKDLPEEGTLENYLLKEGKSNSSRIVSDHTKGAKLAKLDYRILEKKERIIPDDFLTESEETGGDHEKIALAEIFLHTGRHHQIRVQMSGAGMPLLGDRKYGIVQAGENGFQLALCAVSLEFFHPRTEKKMHFTCEPQGEYFKLF